VSGENAQAVIEQAVAKAAEARAQHRDLLPPDGRNNRACTSCGRPLSEHPRRHGFNPQTGRQGHTYVCMTLPAYRETATGRLQLLTTHADRVDPMTGQVRASGLPEPAPGEPPSIDDCRAWDRVRRKGRT
jgi:hypothetical protein